MQKIIIGSRGSELAVWQAEWVRTALHKHHPQIRIDIEIIKTTGDKSLDSPRCQAAINRLGIGSVSSSSTW